MRALLVVNPRATSSSVRTRDVIAHALAAECKVDMVATTHRGHAAELAAEAVVEGVDLVVVHGGDGTVNEVVNGLLNTSHPFELHRRPALAVVPGGSTNVFARVVGYPGDPVEATGAILDALRSGERTRVGLGRADGRWFTFCAGVGFDAEVVRAVERMRESGRRSTHTLYVRTAVTQFFRHTDRSHPALELHRPGHEPVRGLSMAIVANTSPWTFWNDRPVRPTPRASFHTGLDLLAVERLTTLTTLRTARQLLTNRGEPITGRHVVSLHDQAELTLTADRPVAWQVDGEYLGELMSLRIESFPRALEVVVPSTSISKSEDGTHSPL